MQNELSAVEQFWNAVCAKFGVNKPWNSLHPMQQQQVVQAINIIIHTVQE